MKAYTDHAKKRRVFVEWFIWHQSAQRPSDFPFLVSCVSMYALSIAPPVTALQSRKLGFTWPLLLYHYGECESYKKSYTVTWWLAIPRRNGKYWYTELLDVVIYRRVEISGEFGTGNMPAHPNCRTWLSNWIKWFLGYLQLMTTQSITWLSASLWYILWGQESLSPVSTSLYGEHLGIIT